MKQFDVLKQAQQYTLYVQDWHEFFKALVRAGYRSSSMISSRVGLVYSYAFFLIGRRVFGLDLHALRDVVAGWFFMAALTGRYTTSPETVMEQDLGRLVDVTDAAGFMAVLEAILRDTFTEDYWNITLPNDLATASARSPSLFAYYAALNLLDARVLFSKMKVSELFDPASRGYKAALERHHLFPRGYLAKTGIRRLREVNQIANYALVEWSDNIKISNTSPAEYFPKYAARFPEGELTEMTKWHGLPEGWHEMGYQEFLVARRKKLAQVIRKGFERLRGIE